MSAKDNKLEHFNRNRTIHVAFNREQNCKKKKYIKQ